jgi:hypothetical protein
MIIVPNEPLFPVQIKNRCQANTSLTVLDQSILEVKDMVESESSFSFLLRMSNAQLCSPLETDLNILKATVHIYIILQFFIVAL